MHQQHLSLPGQFPEAHPPILTDREQVIWGYECQPNYALNMLPAHQCQLAVLLTKQKT